jgi:hypothetical protein
MAISTTMDIYGVKQAIATLKEIDPEYRKEMLKQVKKAGDPVLVAARSLIPSKPPLSGMGRGNLIKGREGTKWSSDMAAAGFKIMTNRTGQAARSVKFKSGEVVDFKAQPYQLLNLRQKDAAGAIWDHAGAKTRGAFVRNLEVGGSFNPRASEPAVDMARPAVEAVVVDIMAVVMAMTNRKLEVTYGN